MGWRRAPYLRNGTRLQFAGFAIMLFALRKQEPDNPAVAVSRPP
jgi:hypothetical protein